MTDSPAPGLHLQPMVHVQQMEPAVAFYEALGATVLHGSRDGDFVMLRIGDRHTLDFRRAGICIDPVKPCSGVNLERNDT